MKEKIYKRTIYWLDTNRGCGAVGVNEDGSISKYDTAPIFRWMSKKKMKFYQVLRFLKSKNAVLGCKKIGEDIDPF
jgi:hypothetical protein